MSALFYITFYSLCRKETKINNKRNIPFGRLEPQPSPPRSEKTISPSLPDTKGRRKFERQGNGKVERIKKKIAASTRVRFLIRPESYVCNLSSSMRLAILMTECSGRPLHVEELEGH